MEEEKKCPRSMNGMQLSLRFVVLVDVVLLFSGVDEARWASRT